MTPQSARAPGRWRGLGAEAQSPERGDSVPALCGDFAGAPPRLALPAASVPEPGPRGASPPPPRLAPGSAPDAQAALSNVPLQVSAFSTWEKELHKIVFDPRYLLLNAEERKQVTPRRARDGGPDPASGARRRPRPRVGRARTRHAGGRVRSGRCGPRVCGPEVRVRQVVLVTVLSPRLRTRGPLHDRDRGERPGQMAA